MAVNLLTWTDGWMRTLPSDKWKMLGRWQDLGELGVQAGDTLTLGHTCFSRSSAGHKARRDVKTSASCKYRWSHTCQQGYRWREQEV